MTDTDANVTEEVTIYCPDCGVEPGEKHHPYCFGHPDPDALALLACGCPRWEVEAIGHQEGCDAAPREVARRKAHDAGCPARPCTCGAVVTATA